MPMKTFIIRKCFIYTDAHQDHDGNGKNFLPPTDLLASALGTCVKNIMGIEAKQRGWELGEINIDVCKVMKSEGTRKN
tara:strand:+ start:1267 stop:1500 length:234 start_codon:yes stop_codon:yes gene_type:complete